MDMTTSMTALLDADGIDAAVRANHPHYTAVLIGVQNLIPGPSTKESDALLALAEAKAQSLLAGREPHELPEVQAWREAFLLLTASLSWMRWTAAGSGCAWGFRIQRG